MSREKLATYRMLKAKEILIEAKDSLTHKHYGLSVNRSYYAMFTSARTLLALKEMDSSKHSGVIALFNQHIIKTGHFPREISKFLPRVKNDDLVKSHEIDDTVRSSRCKARESLGMRRT